MGKNEINVIDLFSGCGAFSYGFQQAGYNVILGVDNDKTALKTFELNDRNSKGLFVDLYESKSIDLIIESIKGVQVDVIIAGPPCQGYSLTGTRNEKDKRNTLFKSVFLLAERIKPKAIIIENVPGIATLYGGKAKRQIDDLCKNLNFTCEKKVLFAPDYGVPQIRRRMFFVALANGLGSFVFPDPVLTESKYISCEDAIGDLPSLEHDLGKDLMEYTMRPFSEYQKKIRNGSDIIHNHVGTRHTDLVKSVISLVPEGGNHKNLPKGVGESRKFNEAWTRYHSKKPSKTIDTGHRNHFHYKWNRVPTIRENARLQSFPDDFIFIGNKTQQNMQVGNAVPPLLGFHIANQLKMYLTPHDNKKV